MAVAVGASVEYLLAELLELSINTARDRNVAFVNSLHLATAVSGDEELSKLFRNARILTAESPYLGYGRKEVGLHLLYLGDLATSMKVEIGPTFLPRAGSGLHIAQLHGLHCNKDVCSIPIKVLEAISMIDQLDLLGWGANSNSFITNLQKLSVSQAHAMRQRISNDSPTGEFLSLHLFNIKYLNRTAIDSKLASAWQGISDRYSLRDPDDSWANTLELLCSVRWQSYGHFFLHNLL